MELHAQTMLKGRYRLEDVLGRGGMAEVWSAHDERLDRPVAVKVLRSELAGRPDVCERLRREARSAAGLHHPAVVRVLDADEVDGAPFLVMERLPGHTLADRYRDGDVDDAWLIRAAVSVASALACAHRAGVIHRDVKPGNILIAADGDVRLGDFGIAISGDLTGDPTTAGLVLGTPAYLAPERIEGAAASPASDVYGLGVVLYEGFTGERPFAGHTAAAVARSALTETLTPLSERRPDLPIELTRAIDRALRRRPSDRYASAEPFAASLLAGAVAAGVLAPDAASSATGSPVDDPDQTVVAAVDETQVLRHETTARKWWGLADHHRERARRIAIAAAAAGLTLLLLAVGIVALGGGTTPQPTEPATAEASPDTAPPPHDPEEEAEGRGDVEEDDDDDAGDGKKGNGKAKGKGKDD